MRREPTLAEQKLWGALRNRSLDGFKFQRQVPIGPYIVDFICQGAALVVELDGATHSSEDQAAHDATRSAFLSSLGLRVHRIENTEVLLHIGRALDGLHAVLLEQKKKGPHPARWRAPPSPKEKGRR
jgi:5-methyltetrahydrofolate--homocysteine methyltransferase